MSKFIIVKTTCKTKVEAKKIAKILLNKKLISCAQISTIESLYFWENKINDEKEFLLSLKAKAANYKKIEQEIIINHSYKVPQIIQIAIDGGSKDYLQWLDNF